jgi:N-acetylglutamate synthase-like GNAT family acetyltransferase
MRSEHVDSIREGLEKAIEEHWKHDLCQINVEDRFEIAPEHGYSSPVGGRTVLVYDLDVKDSVSATVLEKPSSWLWFDNAIVLGERCKVAYLYLLAIKQEWRRRGVGSAYINAKANVLPKFDVRVIYLQAGYEGPRFWSKRGFKFIDSDKFWADYAEYCEFNDLPVCDDIDDVADKYFEFLRDSNLTYNMYRIL